MGRADTELFRPMESFDVAGKKVLLRLDINSPIDPRTGKIVSENRIDKSIPTIKWLLDQGAAVGVIAHQGDSLDYQNLIPLEEHARKLAEKTACSIEYIDDVCGPAACEKIKSLKPGCAVVLGNLRYLCEEISTFEDAVKLSPEAGASTWLVRSLAPLFDLYINDAFSAAHRNAPSLVSFQTCLPSGAGPLFYNEYKALSNLISRTEHPRVFLLGGAKISDAFGMLGKVLEENIADTILTAGVTGQVFLIASGHGLGQKISSYLEDRNLQGFIPEAKSYLDQFPGKIEMPRDLAYEEEGRRREIPVGNWGRDLLYMDVGEQTIRSYGAILENAGTIFINGPAGAFENPLFARGTEGLWQAAAQSSAYSIVGGGDSVSAAGRFTNTRDFSYICTAGGAMIRFVSGKTLPLIEAMKS